jgi:hypothetical protein
VAYAQIEHRWTDGQTTLMQVGTQADGPDALDECVRRVTDLWHECVEDDAEAE